MAKKSRCVLLPSAVIVMTAFAVNAFCCCAQDSGSSKACTAVDGKRVPAQEIGLPTTGAVVLRAIFVPASGSGAKGIPEHCTVRGAIHPVDSTAPDINFEMVLPTQWNGKMLMLGGGGYDGIVPDVTGNIPAGPVDGATPIQRGYVVVASDSGHQAGPMKVADGSFGTNDEAVLNFTGDAIKKTRDVAYHLVLSYYRRSIARTYFVGGSSGGREALEAAQRWPKDWDGVIALYPAWNSASLDLQFGRIARTLAKPDAYLNPAKRALLLNAVLNVCDALDGVADGIVSDVVKCNELFDPATALTSGGQPLRCSGGSENGDACLSDPQIAALKIYASSISFSYPLQSGEKQYPGFNVYGADLGLSNTASLQPVVNQLALNQAPPSTPMPITAPFSSTFWDQWVRFFVSRNPGTDSLKVDPEHPGALQARISTLSKLQDVNKTDLSVFAARGGKILMAHGTADVLVSTRASEDYYRRLQSTMGTAAVKSFVRYYEIAGYGHAISTRFNASWDSLSVLEDWVEHSVSPRPQTVTDSIGVPGRTRPLCEWPGFPGYSGQGDVNVASSFRCQEP